MGIVAPANNSGKATSSGKVAVKGPMKVTKLKPTNNKLNGKSTLAPHFRNRTPWAKLAITQPKMQEPKTAGNMITFE